MRIQMITPEFPPRCGGIGYYVFYLSRELVRKGYDVSVLVRGKKNEVTSHENFEYKIIKVPGIPPFNHSFFARKLYAEIDKKNCDLIHTHSTSMPVINTSLPLIVTSHWCIKENTLLFHRPINNIDSLYRNLFYKLYCWFEQTLIKQCNLLTVVSKSMQEDYGKLYGVKSAVVYNGVDIKKFSSPPYAEREKTILYYGALKQGKGLLDLLQAIKILNKKQRNYKLLMYGDGPLRKKMVKIVRQENLENVFLHKPVNHTELVRNLGKCSLFVLPSYYEGLPTCILEAMACEVPVIASNVKGNKELVTDGFNGYLFEKGDTVGLAERLESLMQSSSLRATMGKNGRAFVCENFTWDKVTDRFIDIYRRLA